MTSLYNVLGVGKDASEAEIKAAYKKGAMKHHPDRNQGVDNGFTEMKLAYEVLIDKERRAKYDATGETQVEIKSEDIIRTEIALIFGVMLDTENDYTSVDIVKCAKQFLKNGKSKIFDQVKAEKLKLDKVLTAKSRMKRKDDGVNIFESLLGQREQQHTAKIEQLNLNVDLYFKLMEELENYEYEFEAKPEPDRDAFIRADTFAREQYTGGPFGGM